MNPLDYDAASQYALERLERELSSALVYHCVGHTRDDVVPAVERLAEREGIDGEDRLLLLTAAWFHDLGFVEDPVNHEQAGARIAAEVLTHFGYTPAQIEVVERIILCTRLPQSPVSHVEQVMADADLDILGRDDFWPLNARLRAEREALNQPIADREWYSSQTAFLQDHRYFTESARALRDAGKHHHLEQMQALLSECEREQAGELAGDQDSAAITENKIAILRTVSLFAETPEDVLANVAALLQPVTVPAGEPVFHKDDPGECMYTIASGRVRVHDGEMTLNFLGPCDVFGEMALLDTEARVASVTTVEDTHLFRLDQVPFRELMFNQTEVAMGVIAVLNRRLRARVRDMAHDFEYMQQMARVAAAAAALETGRYDSRSLDDVGKRSDELGQLARVFQRMADEVIARERRLQQEVQLLRIQIDEERRVREVAEITGSEYFQELKQRASRLRKRREGSRSEGDDANAGP